MLITDSAAADVDGYVTMIRVWSLHIADIFRTSYDFSIFCCVKHILISETAVSIHTHRAETSASVNRAEHLAARDVDGNVAADASGLNISTIETTTTAKDVTIDIRGAPGSDSGDCAGISLSISSSI